MTFAEYGFTLEDYVTRELGLELSRGGRYVCCPLHDENTASFRIYDDEDTFYCYGCNVGGDVVVLHQKLAAKAGRNIKYGVALGEVRKIVYKHTKNEKVLEKPKFRRRGDYEVDGNRVVARSLTKGEVTEASVAETKASSAELEESKTGDVGAADVPVQVQATVKSVKKPQRSALETLRIVRDVRSAVRMRDLPQAQRLLYQLENF